MAGFEGRSPLPLLEYTLFGMHNKVMELVEIRIDTVDSTQTYAKKHFPEFEKGKITCILAEEQTAGRGRFSRSWHSPKGANLYATFVFALASPMHLGSIGQVMALSLAAVLLQEELHPRVKWPNDVLLGGKKLAGVLAETQMMAGGVAVFLGIGINVNLDAAELKKIEKPATSLKVETGRDWNRDMLFKKLCHQFVLDLDKFKRKGFELFHHQFENLMAFKGKTIHCFDGKKEWVGICHSLTNDGQLNLFLPDHTIHTVSAGDLYQ